MASDECKEKAIIQLNAAAHLRELSKKLEDVQRDLPVTYNPGRDYKAEILIDHGIFGGMEYGLFQSIADDLNDAGLTEQANELNNFHTTVNADWKRRMLEENREKNTLGDMVNKLNDVSKNVSQVALTNYCSCNTGR